MSDDELPVCWFARDVTKTMFRMPRTKAFLSSVILTLFSCKVFNKTFCCIGSSNVAALSLGCKPGILAKNGSENHPRQSK